MLLCAHSNIGHLQLRLEAVWNMTNSVKSFTVGYDPINEDSVFRCGDSIKGQITLDLARACSVKSLCIKLKGKAEVKWWENYGRTVVRFHKKEKLFSVEQFIIEGHRGKWSAYTIQVTSNVCHVFPSKWSSCSHVVSLDWWDNKSANQVLAVFDLGHMARCLFVSMLAKCIIVV